MNERPRSSSPKTLLRVIYAAVVAAVVYGTLDPWPVAVEHLARLGPGPYVPLNYSYSSSTSESGTKTHRSQTYWVVSQYGKSWSAYEVAQNSRSVSVREVPNGLLYYAAFALALTVGCLWTFRPASLRLARADA